MRAVAVLLLVGCAPQNDLPGLGHCVVPGAGAVAAPVAESLELVGHAAGFDDLRFVPSINALVVVAVGTGTLYLIDPPAHVTADTAKTRVTAIAGLPHGIAVADGGAGFLFAADRAGTSVVVIDPRTNALVTTAGMIAKPDYLRVLESRRELWVTEPDAEQIEVLAIDEGGTLARRAVIATSGGPEGLAIDEATGRAFAHGFTGEVIVIDTGAYVEVARWATGCTASHGSPGFDGARGLVFAGCAKKGGAVVLDGRSGAPLSGYQAGGGEAVLGYSAALRHLYLRGDPGSDLAILGVCDSGGMPVLGTAAAGAAGHAMASDKSGGVWLTEPEGGRLLHFSDSFPPVR